MTHEVERELIKLTKYKVKRKFDNRQDYLGSILNAVDKYLGEDEEKFAELSDEAQDWVNAASEAFNNKEPELPDFDEVQASEADEADEEQDNDDDSEPDSDDEEDTENGEEMPVAVEAALDDEPEPEPLKKLPSRVTPKIKKEALIRHGVIKPVAEVPVDKWGCSLGSKNSKALAMFEKGATSKEVKEVLGGTFYNILAKVQKEGHKVEKEGHLVKLSFVGPEPEKKTRPKRGGKKG
jgi:hypothetical protein